MANKRITELDDVGTPDGLDVLEIVDVSDTTDSPDGTSKFVRVSELAGSQNLQQVTDIGSETTNAIKVKQADESASLTIFPSNFVVEANDGVNPQTSYNVTFQPPTGDLGAGEIQFRDVGETTKVVAWTSELDAKQNILTETNFGTFTSGLTTVDAIADADTFNYSDASDSNKQKKSAWSNIKALLKTYFDTLYVSPSSLTKTLVLGTTVTTTSTTAVDTNLSYPIASSQNLKYSADLLATTSAGGIKIQVTVPTGAVVKGGIWAVSSTSTTIRILSLVENTLTIAVQTNATTGPIKLEFTVLNSTTAGDVKISFASGTGGSTSIEAQSSMQIFQQTTV